MGNIKNIYQKKKKKSQEEREILPPVKLCQLPCPFVITVFVKNEAFRIYKGSLTKAKDVSKVCTFKWENKNIESITSGEGIEEVPNLLKKERVIEKSREEELGDEANLGNQIANSVY